MPPKKQNFVKKLVEELPQVPKCEPLIHEEYNARQLDFWWGYVPPHQMFLASFLYSKCGNHYARIPIPMPVTNPIMGLSNTPHTHGTHFATDKDPKLGKNVNVFFYIYRCKKPMFVPSLSRAIRVRLTALTDYELREYCLTTYTINTLTCKVRKLKVQSYHVSFCKQDPESSR